MNRQPDSSSSFRLFAFVGGSTGDWRIADIKTIVGDSLPSAERLAVFNAEVSPVSTDASWILRGITSNLRYTTRFECEQLSAKQASLGRAGSTHAALLPIRKKAAWWELPQDERRRIFEESSHHSQVGRKYLPQIARRLHHCRDLTYSEQFDLLTFFDYAPEHSQAFNDLLAELRSTEEWTYVDREVDIRLSR